MKATKTLLLILGLLPLAGIQAQTVITDVTTENITPTASSQTVPGAASSNYLSTTDYTINYGQSNDLHMIGFAINSQNFNLANQLATDIYLRRNTATPGIPAHQQVMWYRATSPGYISGDTRNVESSYVSTLVEGLSGNIINRGTDNMFQNTGDGSGNINNVERVDFIFNQYFIRPTQADHLTGAGFTILERGGNDRFYMAAILAVDPVTNLPTSYGTPALVAADEWGDNDGLWAEARTTLVVRDTAVEGEYRPSTDTGASQNVHGIYFSLASLGIALDQNVFGYSIFAGDTVWAGDLDNLLDWTDTEYFPTDTGADNGGLDLVSGGSAFVDENININDLIVAIPEPASAMLLLAGAGLLLSRRRK